MRHVLFYFVLGVIFGAVGTVPSVGAPWKNEFPPGAIKHLDELPFSKLAQQLKHLPNPAKDRALAWLKDFHFTEFDLASLRANSRGSIFYVCEAHPVREEVQGAESDPEISSAAVPVNPLPSHLILHSKPGAPNVLYLNFSGETVVNTEWNDDVGRSSIPAVPFSSDSDFATFSDAEQVIIKKIWERVAEDYAPFNIDVTTERPSVFTSRTAHALITRTTDANGELNPYSTGGGVAYVNVFSTANYAKYRPIWIYHNNLSHNEALVAEATSHEMGHNLGLSHDGTMDGMEYYGGHGSGEVSWGPIMGSGYNRNVSQWSKGEYYRANNTQDDLAVIASKISYQGDDHGNSAFNATALVITGGTNIVSTTPDADPNGNNVSNKGILERNNDVDVFSFSTGSGAIQLTVKPRVMSSGTRGGNLDASVELYNEAGNRLLISNPGTQTSAQIQTTLPAGRYFLHVRNSGSGDPFSPSSSGYTSYGSIGQYFISGTVALVIAEPPSASLGVTDITDSTQSPHQFTVTYSDSTEIDVSSIDSNDLRVTGPGGYDQNAQLISVTGTPGSRVATYSIAPPENNLWSSVNNGTYTIWMNTNQVRNLNGSWVTSGSLGYFEVFIKNRMVEITVMSENPDWGTVNFTNGTYAAGSVIQIAAIPKSFYQFKEWTGDLRATNNPLTIQLDTNLAVRAVFGEALTMQHPTPLWWLAEHGYTNDFEAAVQSIGANGIPVWHSYIAGLNPRDPQSQLRLEVDFSADAHVLRWDPAMGRIYTVWSSTNLMTGFSPVPSAAKLPWTVQTFTNSILPATFYRLQVELP